MQWNGKANAPGGASDPTTEGLPDWRDPDAYRLLAQCDPMLLAWEWLRRQRAYREDALAALTGESAASFVIGAADPRARRWNLHAFEDPRFDCATARPVWRSLGRGMLLRASAERSQTGPALVLAELEPIARLVCAEGLDRLLVSNGINAVRVDIDGSSLLDGPVRLRFQFSSFEEARATVRAVRLLSAIASTGRFPPARARSHRSRRHAILIRAHDALAAGASHRELAERLLSRGTLGRNWRDASPSLRSQVQRLARGARGMAGGGFSKLLGLAADNDVGI